jgi:orotidine-5'-phosphate decarboxylase
MSDVRIWVPLDVASRDAAEGLVDRLRPHRHFKVGLEMFTAVGPDAVRAWVDAGLEIFLDLKLHDIPHTVAGAARQARSLGVRLLTVHAAGGREMLSAALEATGGTPVVAAVTVLTSLGDDALDRMGAPPAALWVERLAAEAVAAGCSAVVASGAEAAALALRWRGLRLVVPGVRPSGSVRDDQTRVATPYDVARHGVSDLVVGRPITEASDPVRALDSIQKEAERGLASRSA